MPIRQKLMVYVLMVNRKSYHEPITLTLHFFICMFDGAMDGFGILIRAEL
jgi:hypothetical protein